MRFRWNRRLYRQADQLSRLLAHRLELPSEPPPLLRRYWELFERFPQRADPLALPIASRLRYWVRDIPF